MATSAPRNISTALATALSVPLRKDLEPLRFRGRALRLFKDNQGLLLVAAAQFFKSCMNISVQMLSRLDRPVPPTEILVIRMTITWVLTVVYMSCQGIAHPITGPPEVRSILVIRGICGFCGAFGMYFSLQYLSLSDATVLTFLSPFFTSFAGTFFLGESFSRRSLFAGLVSFVGVVLIARPEALFGSPIPVLNGSSDSAERGTPHQRLLAVGVSMFGVFGNAGAYTSLRAIGKRAHTLHSLTYFALFATIIPAILIVVRHTQLVMPRELKWNILLLGISGLGFLSQFLLITGLQKETASRGSLGIYMQIVFASILERIFFHATPSVLSLTGTAIILSSVVYIGLTKGKTDPQLEAQNNSSLAVDAGAIEHPRDGRDHSSSAAGERTPLLEDGGTVSKVV